MCHKLILSAPRNVQRRWMDIFSAKVKKSTLENQFRTSFRVQIYMCLQMRVYFFGRVQGGVGGFGHGMGTPAPASDIAHKMHPCRPPWGSPSCVPT